MRRSFFLASFLRIILVVLPLAVAVVGFRERWGLGIGLTIVAGLVLLAAVTALTMGRLVQRGLAPLQKLAEIAP